MKDKELISYYKNYLKFWKKRNIYFECYHLIKILKPDLEYNNKYKWYAISEELYNKLKNNNETIFRWKGLFLWKTNNKFFFNKNNFNLILST